MVLRLDQSQSDFEKALETLVSDERGDAANVDDTVRDILADVKSRGDAAVLDYTNRFDRVALTDAAALRISAEEIAAAKSQCKQDALDALSLAADRITAYHQKQMPDGFDYTDDAGIRLGMRWTAIDAVGLYVPGGTASYPSSVLMNAIPARVAGVERLAMVVPVPDGELNPLVLAAAERAGIDEIYRVGGAQAVAALAYGTATIARVDKIVGPGNAYVASAKKQVYGQVGIDMIAGPSEILVVADGENDPRWIAADLLSQAEHDADAQAMLICDDANFADKVVAAVDDHLASLPRANIARASWNDHGVVIVVGALSDAPEIVNRLAPEHLELAVADPDSLMADIRHAGAIFLGRYAPEALGDYLAGPSHVLPTSRSARFSSGLGVHDFLKRNSIIGFDEAGLDAVATAAETLAREEGLDAHALSVSIRSRSNDKG